jgi:hypothetical protein
MTANWAASQQPGADRREPLFNHRPWAIIPRFTRGAGLGARGLGSHWGGSPPLHEVFCMLATLDTEKLHRQTSIALPPQVRAGDDDDDDSSEGEQEDSNDLDEDLDVVEEPVVAPLEQIDDFDEDDFDDDFDDDFEEDLEDDEEDFTSDSADADDFENN